MPNNTLNGQIMKNLIAALAVFFSLALLSACDATKTEIAASKDAYAGRYHALPSKPTLLQGATLLTGTGEILENADVLIRDGKIERVGKELDGSDAVLVDVSGKWITPGIIDVHSHLGVYPSPGIDANSDGNESTAPVTAEVWAEHSVWPQDPGFVAALTGGITSLQILPGSANLIGGRSITLKNVPARNVQSMKFPGAPYGLKMACGENPKRVYGSRGVAPSTRMGNVAGYRAAWIAADDYRKKRAKGDEDTVRDLKLETLADVLDGKILVHNHCYRADEMSVMIDVAKEFGYKITAFHHAVEAYKIADLLAENDICAAVWSDWWGFKMESYDGIRENAALLDNAGACAIIHSDDDTGIQVLNQEAAKVMGAAARVGINIAPERAIQWLTKNPAKALGIEKVVGTLEPGKMADVVVWSGNPFSVYSLVDDVFIDGALIYERGSPAHNPVTDFSLGNSAATGGAQ